MAQGVCELPGNSMWCAGGPWVGAGTEGGPLPPACLLQRSHALRWLRSAALGGMPACLPLAVLRRKSWNGSEQRFADRRAPQPAQTFWGGCTWCPWRPWPALCRRVLCFPDEQSYLLRDAEAEVLFSFSLEESLKRARASPLFKVGGREWPPSLRASGGGHPRPPSASQPCGCAEQTAAQLRTGVCRARVNE